MKKIGGLLAAVLFTLGLAGSPSWEHGSKTKRAALNEKITKEMPWELSISSKQAKKELSKLEAANKRIKSATFNAKVKGKINDPESGKWQKLES